jgi:CheY-like chemotaxis protein
MTDGVIWLLIDDDSEDRDIFTYALESIGADIRLLEAANGKLALELLESLEEEALPRIIFLDLNMPHMGGRECLQRLKASEHLRDIPVIIYTTSANPQDVKELKIMGAHDFMTKPSDIRSLMEALKTVIDEIATLLSR